MTEAAKARRLRASENFRRRREESGESQIQIWLRQDLRERLDAMIREDGYRNRSEAMSAALNTLLEGRKM